MFKKAQRQAVHIKLALTGPAGSGKTYSALKIAFGLADGGSVAVLDSENGSANLYADLGDYDSHQIGPPFTTDKYIRAIKAAVSGGYRVLVIDSLSHAWAGEGGLLQQKELIDKQRPSSNQFTNWAPITKLHEELKGEILQSPIHVIVTMRSKTEYTLKDRNGKQQPERVGMAPVQREGYDYEFTTVFDLSLDHSAITTKDRTGLFDGLNQRLSEEHGKQILAWLKSASAPAAPAHAPEPAPVAFAKPKSRNELLVELNAAALAGGVPVASGRKGIADKNALSILCARALFGDHDGAPRSTDLGSLDPADIGAVTEWLKEATPDQVAAALAPMGVAPAQAETGNLLGEESAAASGAWK